MTDSLKRGVLANRMKTDYAVEPEKIDPSTTNLSSDGLVWLRAAYIAERIKAQPNAINQKRVRVNRHSVRVSKNAGRVVLGQLKTLLEEQETLLGCFQTLLERPRILLGLMKSLLAQSQL